MSGSESRKQQPVIKKLSRCNNAKFLSTNHILQEQCRACYAGISNVHINYNGEVWPCCVLGYSQTMGFLREQGYDFQKIWHLDQANGVRGYIKDGHCACPLANQAYSNILCNIKYMSKAVKNIWGMIA
ncbi:MAG: SPASM domain-containing protein [Deltaproteobacteria bacterium]|nr:SPASM domain-containing protein [Deltaproteobacteria bacterium]